MSGKKRRLEKANKKQLIAIILIIGLVIAYFEFFGSKLLVVSANFQHADSSVTSEYKLTVVSTPATRSKGLMFIKELDKHAGMLFIFPEETVQSFWMKNTYLALDMIFMDKNLKVVGTLENVPPLNTKPRSVDLPSKYVLELNAGAVKEHKIQVGSVLKVNGKLPDVKE